jgi:hypothetical protein
MGRLLVLVLLVLVLVMLLLLMLAPGDAAPAGHGSMQL